MMGTGRDTFLYGSRIFGNRGQELGIIGKREIRTRLTATGYVIRARETLSSAQSMLYLAQAQTHNARRCTQTDRIH